MVNCNKTQHLEWTLNLLLLLSVLLRGLDFHYHSHASPHSWKWLWQFWKLVMWSWKDIAKCWWIWLWLYMYIWYSIVIRTKVRKRFLFVDYKTTQFESLPIFPSTSILNVGTFNTHSPAVLSHIPRALPCLLPPWSSPLSVCEALSSFFQTKGLTVKLHPPARHYPGPLSQEMTSLISGTCMCNHALRPNIT